MAERLSVSSVPRPTRSPSVWFSAPRTVDLVEEEVSPPQPGEVTVRAIGSLVSRGTEMLAYRGEFSPDMPLGLETAAGSAQFPIKYGYQVVGRVIDVGDGADFEVGELVFARHPHQATFTLTTDRGYVRRLPPDMRVADALFLNLAEVALGGLHDAPIRYGDLVVVFGLGVVGAITALLAQQSGVVLAVDPVESRREAASALGIGRVLDPVELPASLARISGERGADVVVEASGRPETLQECIAACGREGTILVVSFYGARTAELHLNERFHFLRQRIVSSQVGTVGSGLQPRWDRERRFQVTADLSSRFRIGGLLSHEADITNAGEAYRRLDERPGEIVALAIRYGAGRIGEDTTDVR